MSSMLSTPPLCWTHLAAFASGGSLFAAVFYRSGRLFSRLSPGYRSLGTIKQAQLRYHAAVGLNGAVLSTLGCYACFFGHLSLEMISKDIPVVRHASAFNLGFLLADVLISVFVPVTGPGTALSFGTALHHFLTGTSELMSLVHAVVPYVVAFHHRMDLTATPTRLMIILKTLGVSRDAPGYMPFWVGSLILNLCVRVLVLPFYWYDFASSIGPQIDDIKRRDYRVWILMVVGQPCFHLLMVKWWLTAFLSLKRYLMNS
ncbi:uncharacterized protein [Branchiostoma lanceolatum]|uniref:uncharacterized protein n=1 Tax=Branchiostoma lanceolatum TaxID=7740 RepID=UPI003456C305